MMDALLLLFLCRAECSVAPFSLSTRRAAPCIAPISLIVSLIGVAGLYLLQQAEVFVRRPDRALCGRHHGLLACS